MKTIIFIHTDLFEDNNASQFILRTGQYLSDQRGFKVVILTLGHSEELITRYRRSMQFVQLGGPNTDSIWFLVLFPFFWWKLKRILKRMDEFILFPQSFPAHWWALVYKIRHKSCPIIWNCHAPIFGETNQSWVKKIASPLMQTFFKSFGTYLNQLDRRLVQNCNYLITPTSLGMETIRQHYGLREKQIKVIPPAINFLRLSVPMSERENSILCLFPEKEDGHLEVLLQAIKELQLQKIDLKFVFLGDGPLFDEAINKVLLLGLQDSIKFLQHLDHARLVDYFQKAKLLIIPDKRGYLNTLVLDALANGLPVMVDELSASSELFKVRAPGFLWKFDDGQLLAQQFIYFLTHPELQNELASQTTQIAQIYNWDRLCHKMGEFMEWFVQERWLKITRNTDLESL